MSCRAVSPPVFYRALYRGSGRTCPHDRTDLRPVSALCGKFRQTYLRLEIFCSVFMSPLLFPSQGWGGLYLTARCTTSTYTIIPSSRRLSATVVARWMRDVFPIRQVDGSSCSLDPALFRFLMSTELLRSGVTGGPVWGVALLPRLVWNLVFKMGGNGSCLAPQ